MAKKTSIKPMTQDRANRIALGYFEEIYGDDNWSDVNPDVLTAWIEPTSDIREQVMNLVEIDSFDPRTL
jgi:hypothetical protein